MLIKLAWRSMVRTRIGFAHGRRVGRCRYGDSLGEFAFDAENVGAAQATQLAELAGGVRPEQIAGRGFVGAVLVDSGKPSDDFLLRPAVEQNALKKDCLDEPKCVLGLRRHSNRRRFQQTSNGMVTSQIAVTTGIGWVRVSTIVDPVCRFVLAASLLLVPLKGGIEINQ